MKAQSATWEPRTCSVREGSRRTRRSPRSPQPTGGEEKKERNHLRVTSGKAVFCGEALASHGAPQFSQGEGCDSYSPVFSPEADAGSLSAHTRLARAAAAAAAVIPSILNLTSSHTRDEVIAGSARHVRGAVIGRRGPRGGAREARGAGGGAGAGREEARKGRARRENGQRRSPRPPALAFRSLRDRVLRCPAPARTAPASSSSRRQRPPGARLPPAPRSRPARGGLLAAVRGGGGGRGARPGRLSRPFAPPPARRVPRPLHTPLGGPRRGRKCRSPSRAGSPGGRRRRAGHRRPRCSAPGGSPGGRPQQGSCAARVEARRLWRC